LYSDGNLRSIQAKTTNFEAILRDSHVIVRPIPLDSRQEPALLSNVEGKDAAIY